MKHRAALNGLVLGLLDYAKFRDGDFYGFLLPKDCPYAEKATHKKRARGAKNKVVTKSASFEINRALREILAPPGENSAAP